MSPPSSNPSCIYCKSAGPFTREHAIPQAFGEFDDLPDLLDRVCGDCNSAIGRGPEQQFCRASLNAVFRHLLGIQGNPRNEKVNPYVRGSAGGWAIDVLGEEPDTGLTKLYEFTINDDRLSIRDLCQVVFVDSGGRSYPLRLRPHITTADELRVALTRLRGEHSIVGPLTGFATADDEEKAWVEGLVASLGEGFQWMPEELEQPYVVKNPSIRTRLTRDHLRAVAKAAFHYVLATVPVLTGHEDSFGALREYIRHGGENQFVEIEYAGDPTPRMSTFGRDKNHHVFIVTWQGGAMQVIVKYFFAPGYNPATYRVRLGEDLSTHGDAGQRGHVFLYYPDGLRHGKEGKMVELRKGPAVDLWVPFETV